MFGDIGALELVALAILAVLIFGPDKLPKVIQDVAGFIRKVRDFSENAKQDIRTELGPEFKDFEFEDLNPKTFIRKQLAENDDLGEFKELRSSFDLRKEIDDVADVVRGAAAPAAAGPSAASPAPGPDLLKKQDATGPDLLKKRDAPDRPPFDADAT
ncbi:MULTISPECIES: sec-independent translocase [unclassified Streptomyces]|uniref:sec-independent translocase n=1 Tax=unclassified Streptomyces TaxID=2593676 RepID=UPI0008DCABFB|nr:MULTISPECIES: sec-independent translocase [unclassified Streptomyces]OII70300.1 Sec-independent protein translocase TatB [Streptomyces sp. CC77]